MMPFGDATPGGGQGKGPRGQGPGTGRGMGGGGMGRGRGGGQGRGRMGGSPPGAGPGGKCVCPSCGATAPHQPGAPCSTINCPKCGSPMVRG